MACRRPCGPRSGAPSTRRRARCTIRRTTRGSIRRPRSPTNSAGPDSAVTSAALVRQPGLDARQAGRRPGRSVACSPCRAPEPLGGPDRGRRDRAHTAPRPGSRSRTAVRAPRRRGRRPARRSARAGDRLSEHRAASAWSRVGGRARTSPRATAGWPPGSAQPSPSARPRRRTSGPRRPAAAAWRGRAQGLLVGQPATQRPQVDGVEPVDSQPAEVTEKALQVGAVGPNGVLGQTAPGSQVPFVVRRAPPRTPAASSRRSRPHCRRSSAVISKTTCRRPRWTSCGPGAPCCRSPAGARR